MSLKHVLNEDYHILCTFLIERENFLSSYVEIEKENFDIFHNIHLILEFSSIGNLQFLLMKYIVEKNNHSNAFLIENWLIFERPSSAFFIFLLESDPEFVS